MKTCFFIGHREADERVLPALRQAVEHHIVQLGVTAFVVGHYGGFDRLAAQAVIAAKERHPEITLTLLLPYHPAERPTETPPGFDNTFYPPGMERVPRRFAIVRANRYMARNADCLIAYVWHPASSARDLVDYAKKARPAGVQPGAGGMRWGSKGGSVTLPYWAYGSWWGAWKSGGGVISVRL